MTQQEFSATISQLQGKAGALFGAVGNQVPNAAVKGLRDHIADELDKLSSSIRDGKLEA